MGTLTKIDKQLRNIQIEIDKIRKEVNILRKCIKAETLSKNEIKSMPNHLLLKELEKRLNDFSYLDLRR